MLWAQPREAPLASGSVGKEAGEYKYPQPLQPSEFIAVEPHSGPAPVRDPSGAYAGAGAGFNGAFARA